MAVERMLAKLSTRRYQVGLEPVGSGVDAFPDNSYESAYKHESGDTAIDEGYFVGTNTAPLSLPTGESAPATGKAVRVRICDIATVQNGVITNHRFYFDQVDLLGQLGLLPETPS
jgi:predicted ester cyclase